MSRALLVLTASCSLFALAALGGENALEKKVRQVRATVGPDFRIAVEKPFVVVSDQSEEDFQKSRKHTNGCAVRLLKRDFFDKEPHRPLVIYLFDGEDSYRKHAKKFFGDEPETPYGYYSDSDGALIMNIATGGGTLVHEIVHPFMEADFPKCPAWYNEGLGSLFEACREHDGHIEGVVNWRLPVLKKGIRNGQLVPLKKLLATTSDEFYADPGGMHYAEARYLLHYVQSRGKLREFHKQFKAHAATDPSGSQTLCRILDFKSIAELQADWLMWIENLKS